MNHPETNALLLWADRYVGPAAYRWDGSEPFISLHAVDDWLRDREKRMAGAPTFLEKLRKRVIAAKIDG